MSGHLYADYDRLSGLLGLPACSNTQWSRIVKRLEEQVTELAKWSCGQVQQEIIRRGGAKQWTASFDGFYQTRGHYSNNSSATLHDFSTGKIAYFAHRTKRGPGHNWSGTSLVQKPIRWMSSWVKSRRACSTGNGFGQGHLRKCYILSAFP